MQVMRYPGSPDDGAGTAIQDRLFAAAPHGTWGGVGAGHIGNLMVTGHRTVPGAPMGAVPNLRKGDTILVRSAGRKYTYLVEDRLWVDFRDWADRESQRSPVPGKPGKPATRAAITLSTCATPEDNAAGLFYRDQYHNPAHRIAIVGYLV